MYTNLITSSYHSGIIINDVADHFGIFCLFHGKSKPSKPSNTKYRSFSTENISKFKTKLDGTNFSDVLNVECPDSAYNVFISMYLAAFEDSFPLIERKIVHKYIKREPWFTSGLLTSSKNKSKLLSLKLHKPTEINIRKYKLFNNLYNKLVQ